MKCEWLAIRIWFNKVINIKITREIWTLKKEMLKESDI